MTSVKRRPVVFADIEPKVERIRAVSRARHGLTEDDRLFILWGKSKGYEETLIASTMGKSRGVVRRYFTKVQLSPLIIFKDKVYDIFGRKRFKCRFCFDERDTEMRMQRHVLGHFVPYEIARDISLEGLPKSL